MTRETLTLREHNNHGRDGEREFSLQEADEVDIRTVIVHAWNRAHDDSCVYVSLKDGEGDLLNIVVDREMFVRGLLHTFPELKRADG